MNWSSALLPWMLIALLVFWAVGAHNRLVRLRAAILNGFSKVHLQFDALVQMLLNASASTSTIVHIVPMVQMAQRASGNRMSPLPSAVATHPLLSSAGRSRRRRQQRGAIDEQIDYDPMRVAHIESAARAAVASTPYLPALMPANEEDAALVGWDFPIAVPQSTLRAAAVQFSASLAAASSRPLNRDVIGALGMARDVLLVTWQGVGQGTPTPERAQLLWNAHWVQAAQATRQFNEAVDQYNAASTQFPATVIAWLLGMRGAHNL